MSATPIPRTLTMTIYGCTMLQVGDVFRVDYMPERYTELVYFQVMKISHTVGTSGWTTDIETVI